MHSNIRDCLERQIANGYKIFLRKPRKNQDFQMLKQVLKQDNKSQTDSQAKLVRRTENNLQQSGLPSGVTSSVVQDYTPNNLRSGVTNILNYLQTIDS